MVAADGRLAHDEFCNDRGDDAGDDEAGSSGRFGDEHDRRERYSVARSEERSDADDDEQCGVRVSEYLDGGASEQCASDDEGDEEAADAATRDGCRGGEASFDEDEDEEPDGLVPGE